MHPATDPSGMVLERSPDPEQPDPLVEAALARAHERAQHDPTGLGDAIAELERLASESGNARAQGWAWHHRARLLLGADHLDEAIELLEAAVTSFEDGSDHLGAARSRALLGFGYCGVGDLHSGFDHLGSALAAQRARRDRWGEAHTLTMLGRALAAAHRFEDAQLVLGEAEAVFHALGDGLGAAMARALQATALTDRARSHASSDQHNPTHRIYSTNVEQFLDLLEVANRAGDRALAAHATLGLANARAGMGDQAGAVALFLEAAHLGRTAGHAAIATRADLDRCRSLEHIGSRSEALAILHDIATDDAGPVRVRAEASMLAAELHERSGDPAAAYRTLRYGFLIEQEYRHARQRAMVIGSAGGPDTRSGGLESQLAQLEVDRLESDAEERSRLIAAVAHELRTPLTAVHGFATAMAARWDEWSPADLKEMVELVAQQSLDATNIVEDLLAASGVSRGTLQVIPTVIDVAATIRGEITNLNHTLMPNTPNALADSFRVRQIVRNLISNARRYGGEEVMVAIGHDAESVFVDVLDNGLGIPASDVHRVFEPFARSQSADRVGTSMGLGLPISRELAHLMNGTLTYHRDSGFTAFRLRIPFASSIGQKSGREA